MVPADQDPLEYLAGADPELADQLRAALGASPHRYSDADVRFLVDEILQGFVTEISFGHTYARGLIALVGLTGPEQVRHYRQLVHTAGKHGPTLGKLFAEALVQVIAHGEAAFTERFLAATDIMLAKGAYTLKDPLAALSGFLAEKDVAGARAYLELLAIVFDRPLTYNRCLIISKRLPRLAATLVITRRAWQLARLCDVLAVGDALLEPFFDGLEKGAGLLDEKALHVFVRQALHVFRRVRDHGIRLLELSSLPGLEACRALQVAVPFSAIRGRLDRYLQARLGRGLSVKSIEDLPAACAGSLDDAGIYFDGATFFLESVINRLATVQLNTELGLCLIRLEAGCAEFGTFGFDLEKAADRWGLNLDPAAVSDAWSDLEHFFDTFAVPALAADLFTLVEHGRIRRLAAKYPGLERSARAIIGRETERLAKRADAPACLYELYARIALEISGLLPEIQSGELQALDQALAVFESRITGRATAETTASVVQAIYPLVLAALRTGTPDLAAPAGYRPMAFPYGRRVRPALHHLRYGQDQAFVRRIQQQLKQSGLKVYRSDLADKLRANNGRLSADDLRRLAAAAGGKASRDMDSLDPERLGLTEILPEFGPDGKDPDRGRAGVFRYPEWDCTQNDYLVDHARLTEKELSGHENGFYPQTLQRHQGLVKKIKTAFELLKPEGLQILRQWIEGDDFDYRAMLDFALDRKAGIMPSDRLYIKRMKSARNVAVMLLVDLSKSTANPVLGATGSVLDVEKEAIVLFCEALEVVGDTYAITGFSGTGRLGVDFYTLKSFPESMGPAVRARINAMAPQRNTRMGAAIRHAVRHFRRIDAAIKLLIVLGDGFPNDAGYKKRYAIEDTRKAIFEARSQNIFTHGITVNIRTTNAMDDLFGPVHHTAISDVRELPDKLWRIYSALTH